MDKYEYKVRAEEIKSLIAKGEFAEAVKIADTIDWHRVKSVMMLCTISDLYKINRKFQESKDILLMAYERHPGGRLIVYSLCELSIKMGEFVQAIEYYKEFVQIAPKDTGRYILQYKLYEAQDVSLEERIAVLEEFKKRDYREKWAYELAYLYHRIGLETKCVEECDEMILWFGEGRYVMKALELKQLHQPLTESQQEKFQLMKQGLLTDDDVQEEADDTEDEGDDGTAQDDEPEDEDDGEEEDEADMESGDDTDRSGKSKEGIRTVAAEPAEDAGTEDEEEFKVKTVDLGKYNTLNLQKELAESMREILGDDKKLQFQPERTSMEPVIESIVAPLLQETGDLPQGISAGEEAEDRPKNKGKNVPKGRQQNKPEHKPPKLQIGELEFVDLEEEGEPDGAQPAVVEEKVFFEEDENAASDGGNPAAREEDIPDILLQDTKRINFGDTKEIFPGQKVVSPNILPPRYAMAVQKALQPQQTQGKTAENETPQDVKGAEAKEPDRGPEAGEPVADEGQQEPLGPVQAHPTLMKTHKPSGFEQMLSQEYNGQISLVVPNSANVEKQITGQMNIADIMAEWERTKRENEEKRRQDVRKRVQQHTGNMFSEFDEAKKSGLLEQLEKAVIEAIMKETAQNTVNPSELTEEQLTDIVRSVGRKKETTAAPEPEEQSKNKDNIINIADVRGAAESAGHGRTEIRETVPAESLPDGKTAAAAGMAEETPEAAAGAPPESLKASAGEITKETLTETAGTSQIPEKTEKESAEEPDKTESPKTPADSPDTAAPEDSASAKEKVPIEILAADEQAGDGLSLQKLSAEALSIEAVRELAGIRDPEEPDDGYDRDSRAKTAEKPAKDGKTGAHAEHKLRPFSEEEKELFGRFAHNHKSKEQIIHAIDEMSMDSYSGNVIVTGEEEAGTLDLAKNLVRMMQLSDRNFSGKVAKISGETLNKKDVQATLMKLTDGALIIEHATDMSSGTATDLNKALAKENRGLFVVMEAKKDEMNIFLRKNRSLMDNFNARIDIESLDDHSLVEYAKLYAEEQEYSIDELGILALHTRIADMQTSDHEVTVAEVKDLVDDAIYFADKKNPKHFFDVLFGKRYDAEDMIILREKDFMHY